MLTQQKYLLALTISHIVSSLMVINEIHSKLQYQMNIYIFLPVAILIATSIAYKYVQSMLIYVASFTVLAICSFIFWSNETIIKEVFLHKPSYGCIIYLVIMIISAIVMPFTSPNSIFGIRIPQTEDYPEVWHRAHVFTSALLSLMILPTIIVIFHMEPRYSFVLCNIFLLVSLIIGIVYAVIIAIPIEKAEKMQIAKELEEQMIKNEELYNNNIKNWRRYFMFTKEELLVIEDALKIADEKYIKLLDESKNNKNKMGLGFRKTTSTVSLGRKITPELARRQLIITFIGAIVVAGSFARMPYDLGNMRI